MSQRTRVFVDSRPTSNARPAEPIKRSCTHMQLREWSSDVIVLSSYRRHGVGRMRLCSDAERIVRTATVRVLPISRAGVDVEALAAKLQHDGADAFVKSWQRLLQRIAEKSAAKAART